MRLGLAVAVAAALVDQLSKAWVVSYFASHAAGRAAASGDGVLSISSSPGTAA